MCFIFVENETIKVFLHRSKLIGLFNWCDKFDIIIKTYFDIRKFEHGVLLFATRWRPNVKNESLSVEHQEKKYCAKLSWDDDV